MLVHTRRDSSTRDRQHQHLPQGSLVHPCLGNGRLKGSSLIGHCQSSSVTEDSPHSETSICMFRGGKTPLENDNTSFCLWALLGSSLIGQLSSERLIPNQAVATLRLTPVGQLTSRRFIPNWATAELIPNRAVADRKVHPRLGYCLCLCVPRREAFTRKS